MRLVCSEVTCGVLYHEIFEPKSAPRELAQAAGLALTPGNLMDLALGYISEKYLHYHIVPDNLSQGISYVLDKVAEQVVVFKQKYGHSPCFVIVGADLLAKENKDMFVNLVNRAKYLANMDILRLVFVSSEGNVIPLIESTSANTRGAPVIEVVDISDEEGERMLSVKMKELAKEVVALTGGRIIQVLAAYSMYDKIHGEVEESEEKPLIIEYLLSKFVLGGARAIMRQPTSYIETSIMKKVVDNGSIAPHLLPQELNLVNSQDQIQVAKAIDHLVRVNFLRYQSNGSVTCHSRIVKFYVVKEM